MYCYKEKTQFFKFIAEQVKPVQHSKLGQVSINQSINQSKRQSKRSLKQSIDNVREALSSLKPSTSSGLRRP